MGFRLPGFSRLGDCKKRCALEGPLRYKDYIVGNMAGGGTYRDTGTERETTKYYTRYTYIRG